jgi:hypothetical protein
MTALRGGTKGILRRDGRSSSSCAVERAIVMVWLSALFIGWILAASYRRGHREDAWAFVLRQARHWAESVGGTLKRVSEQPGLLDHRRRIIARRYRVTFTDKQRARCVAILRYTVADGNDSMEELGRDEPALPGTLASVDSAGDRAAESYARRHRARTSDVSVIFASPRDHKPPRRSR